MNKAAFLDILNHVTSISEQEVIELEKLALNFPYCQSAHLLLAKAAYDRGSMLSNQRLRRAAACAANRQLLKKLINTAGHHLVLEPIADEVPITDHLVTLSAEQPGELVPEEDVLTQEPAATPAPSSIPVSEDIPVAALEPIEPESLDVEAYDADLLAAAAEATQEEGLEARIEEIPIATSASQLPADQDQIVPDLEPIEPEPLELEALAPAPQQAAAVDTKATLLEPIELEALELEALPDGLTAQQESSALLQPEAPTPVAIPAGHAQQEAPDNSLPDIYRIPELATDADLAAVAETVAEQIATGEPQQQQDLPQASQINYSEDLDDLFRVDFLASVVPALDPVAAFVSTLAAQDQAQEATALPDQVQPQLGAAPAPLVSALLPGEAEAPSPTGEEADETLARFDNFLFSPEKEQEEPAAAAQAYQEEILYKVFDANDLGYWMDSSRLGETLLRKNELARAQPYYFQPELLLEYSRHHEMATYQAPEPSILARQFDIIDQFLKLSPKIKSRTQVKIKTESQEDLSLKSTKIRKNTASETLATILVQQGKIKKAIKIYEHLILKLPEKKDYFASQIAKLKTII